MMLSTRSTPTVHFTEWIDKNVKYKNKIATLHYWEIVLLRFLFKKKMKKWKSSTFHSSLVKIASIKFLNLVVPITSSTTATTTSSDDSLSLSPSPHRRFVSKFLSKKERNETKKSLSHRNPKQAMSSHWERCERFNKARQCRLDDAHVHRKWNKVETSIERLRFCLCLMELRRIRFRVLHRLAHSWNVEKWWE